jgi:hypothetical protein
MSIPVATGQECIRAWEAMSSVLQDGAVPGQGEWLSQHMSRCESCNDAFEQQRRLRLALSSPTQLRIDANLGLRRLLERIDARQPQQLALQPSHASWWVRGLMAAVLIQACGLGLVGRILWWSDQAPAYRTLSQEPDPATTATTGKIRVIPDPAMAVTDWNALLHVLRLRVVGGPDKQGAYTVAPLSAASSTPRTLQQLRATHGIRLAEPVPTP